jgi:hypothetical protein
LGAFGGLDIEIIIPIPFRGMTHSGQSQDSSKKERKKYIISIQKNN